MLTRKNIKFYCRDNVETGRIEIEAILDTCKKSSIAKSEFVFHDVSSGIAKIVIDRLTEEIRRELYFDIERDLIDLKAVLFSGSSAEQSAILAERRISDILNKIRDMG